MITDEGLMVTTREGVQQTLPADSIITALPLQASAGLAHNLGKGVAKVHPIGDCREPGYMYDAIADGYRIGRLI